MQQLALFEEITELIGWQTPLHEFRELPEHRQIPQNSIFTIDLKNPAKLEALNNKQLDLLCIYWGCPRSGNKLNKIMRILEQYRAHKEAKKSKEYLINLKRKNLVELHSVVSKGAHRLNKDGLTLSLMNWADNVHEPLKTLLAEARHYKAVEQALRNGEHVPDIVIAGNPTYVDLERKIKGLPLRPFEMTSDEWLEYQNRIKDKPKGYRGKLYSEKAYTSSWLEAEKHWQAVEQAIKAGKVVSEEVMTDHLMQTSRRNEELDKAVTERPEIMKGDKVRYGDKIGRVQHARTMTDSFNYEYFIHTGRTMKTFPEQWEFFTAPVGEVELIEINHWVREKHPIKEFKEWDYVEWTDLDGKYWLGHINKMGDNWVNMWLYSTMSNPLMGASVVLDLEHNPTLKLTDAKIPITEAAEARHKEYYTEYLKKPNRAYWFFLKRLNDLFGLELPET